MDFSVNGVEGETRQNVLAWLGAAPQTIPDRLNFVISARERVEHSLQALGYYQPTIDIDIQRTDPVWQLNIAIEPGEPVKIQNVHFQVAGPAANDPEFARLISRPDIAYGDTLHHGRFENFRKSLLSLGQQRGYFDAKISLSRVEVNVAASTANVFVEFDSGRRYQFGEFIYDSALVDIDLLNALRAFQRGDAYNQVLIQEFQNNLQRTGFFPAY